MDKLSRRRFFGSVAATAAASSWPMVFSSNVHAAVPALVPRKLPFPPNDNFGNYEPTISADGNSIYFARFLDNGTGAGDKRVTGPTDIYVTHRVRQTGEWPGVASDWSPPERLPDTVNSKFVEQEPWIAPDDKSLYFLTSRRGLPEVWVSQRQSDGQWGQAQPVAIKNINDGHRNHCFYPFELPGQPAGMCLISLRPREAGKPAMTGGDIYTTHQVNGVWQPAQRYSDPLLDSIALKCRFNMITRDGLTLGIVSVHDSTKFHTMLLVHYDPASKRWKGPIIEPPFNDWNIDGACPCIQANGEMMIWSAGYDRGPGPVSTSGQPNSTGGLYDLFWLPTSEVVAYYKAKAGLS